MEDGVDIDVGGLFGVVEDGGASEGPLLQGVLVGLRQRLQDF